MTTDNNKTIRQKMINLVLSDARILVKYKQFLSEKRLVQYNAPKEDLIRYLESTPLFQIVKAVIVYNDEITKEAKEINDQITL